MNPEVKTIMVYTLGTINLETLKQSVIGYSHKPREVFDVIQYCKPSQYCKLPHFAGIFTVEKQEVEINKYISTNMDNLTEEDINELNKKYNLNRVKDYW